MNVVVNQIYTLLGIAACNNPTRWCTLDAGADRVFLGHVALAHS